MSALFWLVIVLSLLIGFFVITLQDIINSIAAAPTEARVVCAIVVLIGVLYIFIKVRQDSKSK